MEQMNYTELDWRWAIVLGVALRDGLLEAGADEPAEVVARQLDLAPRAVCVLVLFEGVEFVPIGTHLVFARNPG